MEITTFHGEQGFKKLLTENNCLDSGVECGVAEGRTSLELLQMGVKKLILVDLWETHPEMKGDAAQSKEWHEKNMSQVYQKVQPFQDKANIIFLKGFSDTMAKNVEDDSLGFAYLDANHAYEYVKKDLEAWVPKVRIGGIVSGHDFLNPAYGVKKAVMEYAAKYGYVVHVIPEQKIEDASFFFQKI